MKIFGFPLSVFCLVSLCLPISAQPTWHIITVDSDGDEGYHCSLALDSANKPHIAYSRWYNPWGVDLKYAFYNGNSWDISVIINAYYSADECSLALDSNNKAHISFYYYPYGIPYYLRYTNNVNGTWQFNDVDSSGRYTAIAVDSLNHPHIAFAYDDINGLKYAEYNGTDWVVRWLIPSNGVVMEVTTLSPPILRIILIYPIARMP